MRKYLSLTIVILLSLLALKAQAQNLREDSIKKIAITDAKKFKLDKADLRVFRRNRSNLASDYFKPVRAAVSDTALLKDSVYVKAYREKAWNRTRHRRTVWHYAWMTEAIVGGAEVVALISFLIIHANHGR